MCSGHCLAPSQRSSPRRVPHNSAVATRPLAIPPCRNSPTRRPHARCAPHASALAREAPSLCVFKGLAVAILRCNQQGLRPWMLGLRGRQIQDPQQNSHGSAPKAPSRAPCPASLPHGAAMPPVPHRPQLSRPARLRKSACFFPPKKICFMEQCFRIVV